LSSESAAAMHTRRKKDEGEPKSSRLTAFSGHFGN
jgi:hypothetical protein